MPTPNPTAPGAPQQPPFGQTPVTGPTPNKGFEAAALKRVGLVVKQLTETLQLAGATSDVGKDILKAINMLVKHVPSGAVTPADEKASLERMQMQNTQNGQMQQQMKQGAAQGAGGQGAPPQAAAA